MKNTPYIKINLINVINKLNTKITNENKYKKIVFISNNNKSLKIIIKNNKPYRHYFVYKITDSDLNYIFNNIDILIEQIYFKYKMYLFNYYNI